MTSDENLMLQFQGGSRDSFEELFARYREPLYGFFRRRIHSRERAEDLMQETFLAVIRGACRYEPRALVRTYLYAVLSFALDLETPDSRKKIVALGKRPSGFYCRRSTSTEQRRLAQGEPGYPLLCIYPFTSCSL